MADQPPNTQIPSNRPVTPEAPMSNPFMEPTTIETELTNQMRSQIRDCLVAPELSPTTETIEKSAYLAKTLSWD